MEITPGMPTARKYIIKVVVIGDSGVGKTSLIQMFQNSKFTEHFKPTIGADFSAKDLKFDDCQATLQIWDTAGQERFQSLSNAFYRGADCCILVYDITQVSSFQNLNTWRQQFLQKASGPDIDSVPFMVVGNKLDMESEHRKVSSSTALSYCNDNGEMLFLETSAKDNVNVEKAFRDISSKVIEKQMKISSKAAADMRKNIHSLKKVNQKFDEMNSKKKNGCC